MDRLIELMCLVAWVEFMHLTLIRAKDAKDFHLAFYVVTFALYFIVPCVSLFVYWS